MVGFNDNIDDLLGAYCLSSFRKPGSVFCKVQIYAYQAVDIPFSTKQYASACFHLTYVRFILVIMKISSYVLLSPDCRQKVCGIIANDSRATNEKEENLWSLAESSEYCSERSVSVVAVLFLFVDLNCNCFSTLMLLGWVVLFLFVHDADGWFR